MLGKRSSPLLQTTSKLSFFHGEDCDPKPVNLPACSKHPSVPQHVMLGFDVQQETKPSEFCESPRSVLDVNVLASEKHPPGRSFRSYVRALPLQNRGSQGVGLAIIVDIHEEEKEDYRYHSPVGHDLAFTSCQHESSRSTVCPQSDHHNQRSQPIAIAINCPGQDESTNYRWTKYVESSGSEDALSSSGNASDMKYLGVDYYATQKKYVAHDKTTYNVDNEDANEPSIFSVASIPSDCGSVSIHVASFLDACAFCQRALPGKDIFMYRGDQAFCSAECRGERMTIDEYKEKLMTMYS
ncbi:hypothetical protein L7F22_011895 [Adiantum nelumboides]|nr:hypothetical protein [Adiantum nelumboides]